MKLAEFCEKEFGIKDIIKIEGDSVCVDITSLVRLEEN